MNSTCLNHRGRSLSSWSGAPVTLSDAGL